MGELELGALCPSILGLLGYFVNPGMILGWVSESWGLCVQASVSGDTLSIPGRMGGLESASKYQGITRIFHDDG